MTSKTIRWWIGCVFAFGAMIWLGTLAADIGLFLMGSDYTISATLNFVSGERSPLFATFACVASFVLGMLITHLTGWTMKPPKDMPTPCD